jgi:hypothetical protein
MGRPVETSPGLLNIGQPETDLRDIAGPYEGDLEERSMSSQVPIRIAERFS